MHDKEKNNQTKIRLKEVNLDKISDIFKILSDKTKLKIIIALLEQEICVHDLVDISESTQSNVSHALAKMKKLKILKDKKIGKHIFYQIYDSHIIELLNLVLTHSKEC